MIVVERWVEHLTCPNCGKAGTARLSQADGWTVHVDKLPEGFYFIQSESGRNFYRSFLRQPSGTLMMSPLENGQSVAHIVGMSESGHRSCKCGAVYDRSEHIAEAREISSFECAVCGATIENWNSAWVTRYRFIACPARDAE